MGDELQIVIGRRFTHWRCHICRTLNVIRGHAGEGVYDCSNPGCSLQVIVRDEEDE